MAQKVTSSLAGDLLAETVREILYFPAWWYAAGLKKAADFSWQRTKNMEIRLGVKIWITNLFTPMFGQRDIAGKLISFFVRVSQIIGRSLVLILWGALMAVLFLLWVCLPIAAVLLIILNLAAL